jgi:hypothetical protein
MWERHPAAIQLHFESACDEPSRVDYNTALGQNMEFILHLNLLINFHTKFR